MRALLWSVVTRLGIIIQLLLLPFTTISLFLFYLFLSCYNTIVWDCRDIAEHTVIHSLHWEPSRHAVKAFVGGTSIALGDVYDPSDLPPQDDDGPGTFVRGAQCFYLMVDDILRCKEDDEKKAEAEVRANRRRTVFTSSVRDRKAAKFGKASRPAGSASSEVHHRRFV